ncbi:LysM peptidoglycan-binding domain-containing protein [Candidatus Saccharibacteria bacterium]|nr:LysM peptidoglycan-binding domain-containing protein [Candidatus Saccharibacteria bacterium]
MHKSALAGLSIFTFIAVISSTTSVKALEISQSNDKKLSVSQPLVIATLDSSTIKTPEPKAETTEVKYAVLKNDSLSTVAKKYETTWKRIFDKNETVKHPDIITVGQELIIPTHDEALTERTLPVQTPTLAQTAKPEVTKPATSAVNSVAKSAVTTRPVSTSTGSSAGNLYTPGYCTWYVKNRRPDLPNNLGNADTWVSRAASQGIATGSVPRAGAVGQRNMHVVYVERVNSDNTVTISEMNYQSLYTKTERTLPANYFTYIY